MELIPIQKQIIDNKMTNAVDARELCSFVGSRQEFATWVKNKILNNPYFEYGIDYVLLDKSVKQTGSGGHNHNQPPI